VPLHDPLRLAEDITLLDLTSGERFSVTCDRGIDDLTACWKKIGSYLLYDALAYGAAFVSLKNVFNPIYRNYLIYI
jgi:hypothetical protein